MKQIITILFLFLAISAISQLPDRITTPSPLYGREVKIDTTVVPIGYFPSISIDPEFFIEPINELIDSIVITPYGHHPTEVTDTVKSVLLITECDNCVAISIEGYTTRRKWVFYGDPMPTWPSTNAYDDQWRFIEHLDNRKQKLKDDVYVWEYFLSADKKNK